MKTVYIGMGGNVPSCAGPPEATLAAAAARLESLGRVTARSSLYSTEPVGFADQPRFVNAVVALETGLSAHALLDHLLRIEREFGRDRSSGIRNGPRPLDLDILLYGEQEIDDPELQIPHPRLSERAFVLIPLKEIAPDAVDSRRGMKVKALLHSLLEASPEQADAVIPLRGDRWRGGGK